MQANLNRSYKRWQQGEQVQIAKAVVKHFFPAGTASTGLNRRAKIQTVPLTDAIEMTLAAKKSAEDHRSILLALKCNIAKEHSNGIRGMITLPTSTNKDVKVLVIAPPDMIEQAKAAGAHTVGGAELIQDIITGKIKFNRCIATPQMMPVLTKIARYLGPLGLMPTIKNGTLTNDLEQAIKASLNNEPFKITSKQNGSGIMHLRVGYLDTFNNESLQKNIESVFATMAPFAKTVKKGRFIETAHLCVPAEPSIPLEPPQLS